jgi:hypothetical protein
MALASTDKVQGPLFLSHACGPGWALAWFQPHLHAAAAAAGANAYPLPVPRSALHSQALPWTSYLFQDALIS